MRQYNKLNGTGGKLLHNARLLIKCIFPLANCLAGQKIQEKKARGPIDTSGEKGIIGSQWQEFEHVICLIEDRCGYL